MAEAPAQLSSVTTDTEPPAPAETALQVDADADSSETDSAYASSFAGSASTSLGSSITHYTYENGRRYHAYKEGEYILPNDEAEQDRLDLQHHIYLLCLGGALHLAPIKEPQRVLDIGTGTGIWAIEFADEYPSAAVIGTDLSPIQPSYIPPNLKFYVDDFEQPWEFGEDGKFDFIHWRSLCGSTADWSKLYGQAFENLKPGGWLEVQEYNSWVYSDDSSMELATWTQDWIQTLSDLTVRFGKPMNVAALHKQWIAEAGFVDVKEEVCKVPIGPWTRDPKLKELGRFERAHMTETVEAHSMALYTRVLHYSTEQAKVVFENVKKEFNDKTLHLYTVYRFIYGRKPDIGG